MTTSSVQGNRRVAPPRLGSTAPEERVADFPGDESPAPSPTSSTVRPPAPAAKPALGRTLRALQLVAGIAFVLAASGAAAWGAHRYMVSSPRFAIRAVLIDGNARLSADEVAAAGAIEVGNNVFALDLDEAGRRIAADPWIERAQLTRKLPSTVHVTVVEREPRALVSLGGRTYLATRDGELFKELGPGDPVDLPVVTGIAAEQVGRDRAGVVLAVKRALDVDDELERSGLARRFPVQEIAIEKDGSIVVTVGKDAIALHLGRGRFRERIEQASRVLAEVQKRKANAGVVFLDNEANPERVVVRMR